MAEGGPAGRAWQVTLLGGFELRSPQLEIVDLPPAAARVLVCLALERRSASRAVVAAQIWPDADEARARANLRSAVWRLRTLAPIVAASATSLWIEPGVVVDLDLLDESVEQVRHGEPPSESFLRAVNLELLPGWPDEWLDLERERVRQLELHLLDGIVEAEVRRGHYGAAVDAAIRAIRLDPYREASHAGLLRAHVAGGDPAAALNHYRKFAMTMRAELGISPSSALSNTVLALG